MARILLHGARQDVVNSMEERIIMKMKLSPHFALIAALASPALAQNKTSEAQPNRENMAAMHRKMSDLHKKVADCFASKRPLGECQQEMTTGCSAMMGQGGMGMMGPGGMHGMMGQGAFSGCPMMGSSNSAPEESSPKK